MRKLVAVADALDEQKGILRRPAAAAVPQQLGAVAASRRAQLFGLTFGYVAYNSLATLHAYRVAGAEASAALAEGSGDAAEVTLHMRSLRSRAEVRRGGEASGLGGDASSSQEQPARGVFVLPHVYLTDLLFGRSSWMLTCRKRGDAQGGGTQTEWASRSGSGTSIDFSSSGPRGPGG